MMNTLTIKNFLKKQTLFAALIVLYLCGTVTAMNDINENNIGQVSYSSIKNLIYQNGSSGIQKLASYITQDNIKDCGRAIECILEKDASYAKTFASCITQDNIKDCGLAIECILEKDASYAKTFASYITQENFKDCALAIVYLIIQADKSCAKTFASYITQENFKDKDFDYIIFDIIKADQSYAKKFASCITQEKFKDYHYIIVDIIEEDRSYAKLFASYITQKNFEDNNTYLIDSILQADKSCIKIFASLITHDTYFSIPIEMYKLLEEYGLNIKKKLTDIGFPLKKINNLDSYLFGAEKYDLICYLAQKSALVPHLEETPSEKTISTKSFKINYKKIIDKFNHKLGLNLDNRLSINKIITLEKSIIKRGNYPIAHGRSTKFNRFVIDNIFPYLQDIVYGKEIDKTCHYAQHYAFPGELWSELDTDKFSGLPINLPEKMLENLLQYGITSLNRYSYARSTLQFGSNFLSTKGASSALDYTFRNGNVDETRGSVTIESLFQRLGKAIGKDVSKYYKKYKNAFDLLCNAGDKFKHGTMLIYEFTPEALQKYVKVTNSSGGHINNHYSGILIKSMRTTDPKKVLDTLINNPEDFDEPTRDYEFFWPLTDEGTANPFCDEVKTYAFHIGKHDEMLAKNIKFWISKLFERIKDDMIKDGVIKDNGAFKKETINFEKEMITSKM